MPSVHIGEASIHFREAGGGSDVVVLLHGFPLHSGMWEPQLPYLASRFRVIAPDYRGLGRSEPAPAVSSMELLAGDVVQLLRQLGIRRAAFAGLSMGGYVAFELYRRAPELFRGLVLCTTKAVPDTQEQKDVREASARSALAKGLGWVADELGPRILRPEPDPEVLARVKQIMKEGTPEGVAAAQRGMAARPDSVPTLSRITCPTLIIAGEQDQLMPFAETQRMAQTIPGARLVRIPGAGHMPNLEAPNAFNTALSTFLATLPT